MNFATELLQTLHDAYAGRAAPRVRALHLPPSPWTGTKTGEFGALELDSGALGLSYVLLGDTLATIGAAGSRLQGADALQLAQWWRDSDGARAALGFAAVNALSRELFDRAGYVPPPATDSIGGIAPHAGEHIGMVGFFTPLVKQVTAQGARLTILELKTELEGAHDGYTVTLSPAELADCTQVLCTSTVLLNHTLDAIIAACRQARRLVLLGPGASCLPDGLFARGVTTMGGAWVMDGDAFKAALASGSPWGPTVRKTALERSAYPGLAALLARAS